MKNRRAIIRKLKKELNREVGSIPHECPDRNCAFCLFFKCNMPFAAIQILRSNPLTARAGLFNAERRLISFLGHDVLMKLWNNELSFIDSAPRKTCTDCRRLVILPVRHSTLGYYLAGRMSEDSSYRLRMRCPHCSESIYFTMDDAFVKQIPKKFDYSKLFACKRAIAAASPWVMLDEEPEMMDEEEAYAEPPEEPINPQPIITTRQVAARGFPPFTRSTVIVNTTAASTGDGFSFVDPNNSTFGISSR